MKQQQIVLARPITNLQNNSKIHQDDTCKTFDIDNRLNAKKLAIHYITNKIDQERRNPTINLVSLNR